jgi:hypothetical protein
VDAVLTATLGISEVQAEPWREQLRANLESPHVGDSMDGFWIPFTGWAVCPNGDPVDILISDAWGAVQRISRGIRRPDIAAAFPGTAGAAEAGFSVAFNAARQPRAFELSIAAVAIGGETTFATVKGTRRPFEMSTFPILPLAVTTLGRSGSTLLMTLLSQHPEIAAFRPTAYDSRPLAYWLELATGLAAPASRMQILDSTGTSDSSWQGRSTLPVSALTSLAPAVRGELLGASVDGLLRTAVENATTSANALACADGKTGARYAAEKCFPGFVPRVLHELCADTKEIFLVRDFRDVFSSILAFNRKRGFETFGREQVRSDAEFVARFALDARILAASWAERRDQAFLVRYEELVADPETVLGRLFDHLELDASRAQLLSHVESAYRLLDVTKTEHRTTDAVSASTGRWVNDLPPAIRDACEMSLAEPLRQFGYA